MGPPQTGAAAPDAAVIAQSLSRPEAFGAIFDRHFGAVHGYLARRVGNARADDLASSTFVIAFDRRRQFRPDATTARPWLLGIATNLLRSEWRAERRALDVLGRIAQPVQGFPSADEPAGAERLAQGLAELDSDQRDVLLLHAWEELSYEEIAAALAIPVGTVRSRLSRARARLRSALGADADRDSDVEEMSG